jgi:hypothetical protein
VFAQRGSVSVVDARQLGLRVQGTCDGVPGSFHRAPVAGKDLVGPPAEHERIGALVDLVRNVMASLCRTAARPIRIASGGQQSTPRAGVSSLEPSRRATSCTGASTEGECDRRALRSGRVRRV